jgi:hypothetical protein
MLKDCGWVEDANTAQTFLVEARTNATVHVVEVPKLRLWLKTQSRGPRDISLKNMIRNAFGWD